MRAEEVKEQMAGRWESYFSERFGIEVEDMQGVPCPFCGGDDRFSWTNYREAGGYLCRGHAEGRYTDGIGLAQELWRLRGMEANFRDVLVDLSHWLSNAPAAPPKATPSANPVVPHEVTQKLSQVLSGDWSAVALVTHPYVQKKGLGHLVPLANRQTRVKPWGQAGEVIIVPQFDSRDPFGKPIGAEVIAGDGSKWSVKGGKRGVHPLPHRDSTAPLVLLEGWASALAATEMLPCQVVACGGKKTLVRQADALAEATGRRVVICWEDDGDAEAPAGAVVMPRTDAGNDPADWRTDAEAVAEFQRAVAEACATLPVYQIGVEQYEQYEQ